MPETNCL